MISKGGRESLLDEDDAVAGRGARPNIRAVAGSGNPYVRAAGVTVVVPAAFLMWLSVVVHTEFNRPQHALPI